MFGDAARSKREVERQHLLEELSHDYVELRRLMGETYISQTENFEKARRDAKVKFFQTHSGTSKFEWCYNGADSSWGQAALAAALFCQMSFPA